LFVASITTSTIGFAKVHESPAKPPPDYVDPDYGFAIRSIVTDSGVSFDVSGFESGSAAQSKRITKKISELFRAKLAEDPKAQFSVSARLDSSDPLAANLDYEAYALADRVARTDSRIKLNVINTPIDPLLKAKFWLRNTFEKRYHIFFTLLRGIASGGITTWNLQVSAQLPTEKAIGIGIIAGLMSAGLQYFSDPIYNWASRKGILSSYNRMYWVEVAYVGILQAAISSVNGHHPEPDSFGIIKGPVGHVLLTSLWGFSQDAWDFSFTETRKRMERIKMLSDNQIYLRTRSKYLLSAAASMSLLMAQLLNLPNVTYGYVAMGALGAGAFIRSKLRSRREKDLEETAHLRRARIDCTIVFEKLGAT